MCAGPRPVGPVAVRSIVLGTTWTSRGMLPGQSASSRLPTTTALASRQMVAVLLGHSNRLKTRVSGCGRAANRVVRNRRRAELLADDEPLDDGRPQNRRLARQVEASSPGPTDFRQPPKVGPEDQQGLTAVLAALIQDAVQRFVLEGVEGEIQPFTPEVTCPLLDPEPLGREVSYRERGQDENIHRRDRLCRSEWYRLRYRGQATRLRSNWLLSDGFDSGPASPGRPQACNSRAAVL